MAKSSPKRVNPKGVNPPEELSASLKKPKVKSKIKGSAKSVNKNISKNLRKKTFQGRIKRAIKEYEKAGFKISQKQREALLRKKPKDANKARNAVRSSIKQDMLQGEVISGNWIRRYIYHGNLSNDEYYMMRDLGLMDEPNYSKGMSYNDFFDYIDSQSVDGADKMAQSVKIKIGRKVIKNIPNLQKKKKGK